MTVIELSFRWRTIQEAYMLYRNEEAHNSLTETYILLRAAYLSLTEAYLLLREACVLWTEAYMTLVNSLWGWDRWR